MTGSIDGMTSMLFVPLSKIRGLVHVLDNLSPTHSCVVGTERDLALLSAVGDHAHFSAAEIVIEKILKPHALDAKHSPLISGIIAVLRFHPVVAIGAGISRGGPKEIDDL